MGTRGATRPGPCGRSAFLVLTAEVLGFHLPRKVRLRCQLRTLFFQHLSVVVSACHLSTWEVEAKRLGIQVHPQLHSEFRASLADMKPYLKGEKKKAETDSHYVSQTGFKLKILLPQPEVWGLRCGLP